MNRMQDCIIKAKLRANEIELPFQQDVSFIVNSRFTNAKGRCDYNLYNKNCVIQLSKLMLEHCDEEEIINTICHELIHTLPQCRNHGHIFQNWCQKFNQKFNMNMATRYKITDQSEAYQKAQKMSSRARQEKKFLVTCLNCGKTFRRARKLNPDNYRCSSCHGNLKIERI